jgi:hypothetical protein
MRSGSDLRTHAQYSRGAGYNDIVQHTPPKQIPRPSFMSIASSGSGIGSGSGSLSRTPGINQKGAIPGFWVMPKRADSQVQANQVDEEGLREGLADGLGGG